MIQKLKYVLRGFTLPFVVTAIWMLLNTLATAVLNPLAVKYLFDEGVIKGDFRFFLLFGVGSVVVFTLLRLSGRSCQLYCQKFKNSVLQARSQSLLAAYHKIPYKQLTKGEEGYFVSRIYDEARNASWPVIDRALGIFASAASFLGGLFVSLLLSWQLVLILLVVVMPLSLLAGRFSKIIQRQSKLEQEKEGKLRGVITQVVKSYKANNIYALKSAVDDVTNQAWGGYLGALYTRFKHAITYMTFSGIFMSWAEIGVMIASGYLVMIGKLTFGGFMGFGNSFWLLTGGVMQMIDNFPGLFSALAIAERAIEFESLAAPAKEPNLHTDGLLLDNVNFAYGEKRVLANYGLGIKAGERLVIVGPNACGKSTLANIIAGILEPDSGRALIPSKISALTEPVAFPPLPLLAMLPEHRKELAAQLINTLELQEVMAKEYEELSAGQKKKFAVLITVLQDADLYVLDEPLANLDANSKEVVIDTVLRQTEGKTLVVIIHGDEKYYSRFDRVIDLEALEYQAG